MTSTTEVLQRELDSVNAVIAEHTKTRDVLVEAIVRLNGNAVTLTIPIVKPEPIPVGASVKNLKPVKRPDGGTIRPLIKAAIRLGKKAGVTRADITKHVMRTAPTTNSHSLDTALYRMKHTGVVSHHDGRYFLNAHAPKVGKTAPVTTGTDSAAKAPDASKPASSKATVAPKVEKTDDKPVTTAKQSRYVETASTGK